MWDRIVPETWVSGLKAFKRQDEHKAFLHFLQKCLAYFMIFQSGVHRRHCKNFEKSSNMPKKLNKYLVQLA